ncbi:sulfite exporter TauE/SafE family protein [Gallaecimonas kandeliae]|uniref:sulfite exporter TauE/SafE family protein n=1 Tax=Gallaecimonas kandeliae TaxID=3029055 RepID=UPI0026484F8A|nr:sulfite exporter TauE/SafE family protein [Gallaecimonas kandeliae]WKE65433.1 sulfite exporter TauE/SafE family protein [Gallaecimonas kandeliae]
MDWTFWGLTALSAATSFVTASMGAGGGAILIAAMALLLPPAAVIPVHGLVQLGSNLGRASLSWRHVHWPTLAVFVPFSLLGAALASLVLVRLPGNVLQLAIALFVLYLCWGPKLPKRVLGRAGLALAAAGTGFVSLFVGASGPLVAAFIKARSSDRFQTVATFACAMVVQHAPKALVFGLAGFAFRDWWPQILAMLLAGIAGTWLGLRTLGRLSEARFHLLFQLVLTALALELLWEAASGP